MISEDCRWERLSAHCGVYISAKHGFTTDTLLLAHFSPPKKGELCAEFGTGCGTIPMLWISCYEAKHCTAVELQPEAARQAERAVLRNGFRSAITVLNRDIKEYRHFLAHQSLDLIACNPPYQQVGAGVQSADPSRAAARHETALSLSALAEAAAFSLRFGGRLCICQRPERLSDAITVLTAHGLEPKRLRIVQERIDKPPFLFLLESRKGGRPGLRIDPLLLIRDAGGITEEIKRIYGAYYLAK